MGNVVELRPRTTGAPPDTVGDPARRALSALAASTQRLLVSAEELVATLEASLARIRLVIDTIDDADVRCRLAGDHAILCAALRDAKMQLAAVAAECLPRRR